MPHSHKKEHRITTILNLRVHILEQNFYLKYFYTNVVGTYYYSKIFWWGTFFKRSGIRILHTHAPTCAHAGTLMQAHKNQAKFRETHGNAQYLRHPRKICGTVKCIIQPCTFSSRSKNIFWYGVDADIR